MTSQTRPTRFSHAMIFTGTGEAPRLGAITVSNGRIDAVEFAGDSAAPVADDPIDVDLGGRFLSPGITEGHGHLFALGAAAAKVQLQGAGSLAEIQRRLLAARASNPGAAYLLGMGWQFSDLPEGGPRAAHIDEVISDIPVVLDSLDFHSAWTNSAGLTAMGIDADSPDPAAGGIVRDESGAATGLLLEFTLIEYVAPFIEAATTLAEREKHFDFATSAYLESGVTAVSDLGLSSQELEVIASRLERDGRLPLPVTAYWRVFPTDDAEADRELIQQIAETRDRLAREHGTEWFRLAGIKLILDGVIDAHTALMNAQFSNGEHPAPLWSHESLTRMATYADSLGLQLAFHAIGDAASALAIDLVRECEAANGPRPDRRPRLEHLETVTPEVISAMRELGAIASVQPVHADPAILQSWHLALGDHRAEEGFPWHEFRAAEVTLALGTDAPTAPYEALQNLFIAVTGRSALDPTLPPYHPERALSVGEALRAMTWGAAFASGDELDRGLIAPGQRANLLVSELNPFTSLPEDMLQPQQLVTYVNGERFEASS